MREPAAPRENDRPGVRPPPTWRERSRLSNFGARGQTRSLFFADHGDSGSQQTGKATGFIEGAELRRCDPDDVRAAGALVLLYGIQLSRIVELTTSRFHRHRPASSIQGSIAGFSVTLTGPEIALPPALAAIMSRLPMQGQRLRPRPLIVGEAPGWLFPGFSARGHINSSVLSRHLKSQGISTRSAR